MGSNLPNPNDLNDIPINSSTEFTPNGLRQNGKNSTHLGQWKIISELIKEKRGPIELERRLLEEGSHPKYLTGIEQCNRRYEVEMQRINDEEKEETARFEEAYQQELISLEKEYENRINELVGSIWQEVEDKHLDGELSEFNRWDGVKWTNANNIQYVQSGQGPGKKQLRRRPYEPNVSNINATTAGPSNAIEQNSGGQIAEKKARKRSPGASQIYPLVTQTLLSPQTINADLAKFCPNMNDPNRHSSTSRGSANYATISNGPTTNSMDHIDVGGEKDAMGRKRKVILEEGKLICDGKTFYRTQNVSIKSDNTGGKLLQARIMQINDLTVHFRSVIPGDTRVFVASKEDLEKSIITVYKRY